jgi:hypothetical protein
MRFRYTGNLHDRLLHIARNRAIDYVEIRTKVASVVEDGLKGEHLIGVVNHAYDVYVLEAASPTPSILVITDLNSNEGIIAVDLCKSIPRDKEGRRSICLRAANEIGIQVTHVHVVDF